MRARETTGKRGWKYAPQISPKRAPPSHCLHSRHPLLAPSFLYTQWISPSRARCSPGRIVFTHDVPLAPSFPPPYLSYPASGHVRYMTASDGFPVPCCALLGSSSWRVGGRGSLMDVYGRRRVRAGITQPCPRTHDARPSSAEEPGGGRAPRHLPNAPTRGPRVGDMTGNGRERILSSFISRPASARDFFRRRGARSASLVVLRGGVILVPAHAALLFVPEVRMRWKQRAKRGWRRGVIHACGFLDPTHALLCFPSSPRQKT
jgi:hypothetical protein